MNGHLSTIDDRLSAGQINHDTLELKALELELSHIRGRIEDTAVKLAISSDERLRLARMRAADAPAARERIHHTKSELLTQMSHELRTPLNVILGFTEMMRQAVYGPLGSPKYEEYLDHIRQSAERLLELTTDILELCGFGTGRQCLNEEHLDLGLLLDEVVRSAGPCIDHARVRVEAKPINGLAIRADRNVIKYAMVKLLACIAKLTHAAGPIEVSSHLSGTGEILLTIKVSGIAPCTPQIAGLIDAFDQGGSIYRWGYSGTVLGLSMAKALIELHDGTLGLRGEADGMTVSVQLPGERVVIMTAGAAD